MAIRRRRDFEATFHATRARLQSLGAAIIPSPTTIPPHRHHASEIDVTPGLDGEAGELLDSEQGQAAFVEHDIEKLARSGVQPMLGSLDMNFFDVYNLNRTTFDLTPTGVHVEGSVRWENVAGVKRLVVEVFGGVVLLAGNKYALVYNNTGSTMPIGTWVYRNGGSDTVLAIGVGLADTFVDEASINVVGCLLQELAPAASGWACGYGYVAAGPDLASLGVSPGGQIWLGAAGGMAGSSPPKGDWTCATSVRLGTVLNNETPGAAFVHIERIPNFSEAHNVNVVDEKHTHYLKAVPPQEAGCTEWRNWPLAFYPRISYNGPGEIPLPNDVDHVVVLVDASGGETTLQLPTSSVSIADQIDGRFYLVKKVDESENAVILLPTGVQTIEGVDQWELRAKDEFVLVWADGAGGRWRILGNRGMDHAEVMSRISLGF